MKVVGAEMIGGEHGVNWLRDPDGITGDPGYRFGPPPTHDLRPDWRQARDVVLTHLLPALRTC